MFESMTDCTGRRGASGSGYADLHTVSRDLASLTSEHSNTSQTLATKIASMEKSFAKQLAQAVESLEAKIAQGQAPKVSTPKGRTSSTLPALPIMNGSSDTALKDLTKRVEVLEAGAAAARPELGPRTEEQPTDAIVAPVVGTAAAEEQLVPASNALQEQDMRIAKLEAALAAGSSRPSEILPAGTTPRASPRTPRSLAVADRIVALEKTSQDVQAAIATLSADMDPRRVAALEATANDMQAAIATLSDLHPKDPLKDIMLKEEGQTGIGEATPDGEEAGGDEELHELEPWRLDSGFQYAVEESVWDAVLFCFTKYDGIGTSLGGLLAWCMNLFVQIAFCYVVGTFMTDSPVDDSVLTSLLRFRASIAHNVDYAEKTTRNSMISMICGNEGKLHLAGAQMAMFGDMDEFMGNAQILCVLAQFAWICTIYQEMYHTWTFTRALLGLKRGSSTVLSADAATCEEGEAAGVTVTLREISKVRIAMAVMMISLPRFVIAFILGLIGILYLGVTANMSDLLLNAMALAFILDLDALLYTVLVPRRTKVIISNLENFNIKPTRAQQLVPWAGSAFRMVMLVAAIVTVFMLLVIPFFNDLHQATALLCTGETKFVTALSASTGMVHASRAANLSNNEWNLAERSVLQLARPLIKTNTRWGANLREQNPDIYALMQSDDETAVIFPASDAITETPVVPQMFDFIKQLSSMSTEDSLYIPCQDMRAGPELSLLEQLRMITGNSSAPKCDDEDEEISEYYYPLCAKMENSALRAICPRTCMCHLARSFAAGAFQHPMHGCPATCKNVRSAVLEYRQINGMDSTRCMDTPTPALYHDENTEWFRAYLNTTFTYLRSTTNFKNNVYSNAISFSNKNFTLSQMFADYWGSSPALVDNIMNSDWSAAPGVPHPRGLTGCAFLTSFEIKWILSFDFCAGAELYSLRNICPVSCGCGTMEGCPRACFVKEPARPCADNNNGLAPQQAVELTLASILNNESVRVCSDIPLENKALCGKKENRLLREICPVTCGCVSPMGYYVGFWGTGDWGCPRACGSLRAQRLKYDAEMRNGLDANRGCDDVPASSMFPFDSNAYMHIVEMGSADVNLWFTPYIHGVFEYLFSDFLSFSQVVSANVEIAAEAGALGNGVNATALAVHILSGGMEQTIVGGTWELMPGVPHPFGLKGCEYLTSWLIQWLLGFDFCGDAVAEYRTLRYYCPRSCSCGSMPGCPGQCAPAVYNQSHLDDHH